MADTVTREKRSEIMSKVRGKDTRPEMIVRRLVHGMGFRYRLHSAALPGRPDLVFASRRKVIFVHGCWWHRHSCKQGRTAAKSNVEFWAEKMETNVSRDQRVIRSLKREGWKVLVVWECQTKALDKLARKIEKFLDREPTRDV